MNDETKRVPAPRPLHPRHKLLDAAFLAGMKIGNPRAWWPELAPLKKNERNEVRHEISKALFLASRARMVNRP